MAITVGTVSAFGGASAAASLTYNATVDASTTMLAVTIYFNASANPTGVTLGGNAMTLGVANSDGVVNSSLWYYANPPTGTQEIICSFSSSNWSASGAICLLGTDTTIGATNTATGISTAFSGSLTTTVADSMIVLSMGLGSGGTVTPDSPLTTRHLTANADGSENYGATYLATAAAGYTLSGALGTNTRWPMAMVEFKTSGGGAAVPKRLTLLGVGA